MEALPGTTRWSLSDAPEGERLALFQEVYGPTLNMDFAPLAPDPVFELELLPLPGATVLFGRSSPHRVTTRDTSRLNDDLLLVWSPRGSKGRMTQLGRAVEDGCAVLQSGADPFTAELLNEFRPVNVRVPRALLAPMLARADDALMRPIAPDFPPFRLLVAYLSMLRREGVPARSDLAAAVAAHIRDLVALCVGATRDAGAIADGRGGRAARLAAVKSWALERLHDSGLSVAAAAKVQRVSPRSIQMLFEVEGATFSGWVLEQRLARARRRLAGPGTATPISAVAFDAGFGDLSYFNRAFRARYGCTPSDVRQGAASPCDKPVSRQSKTAAATVL